MAEKDMRTMTVSACVQTPDGYNEHHGRLKSEVGNVYVMNDFYDSPPTEELDRAGLEGLRALAFR